MTRKNRNIATRTSNYITQVLNKVWVFVWRTYTVPRHKPVLELPPEEPSILPESFGCQYADMATLLDDLDDAFSDLRKLRPRKHYLQGLIKRYGPYMVDLRGEEDPEGDGFFTDELEGFKAYGFPSFLIGWHRNTKEDCVQTILVAHKVKSCPYKRRLSNRAFYEVCYCVMPFGKYKRPTEYGFFIEVHTKTGEVTAMSIPTPKQTIIPSKKHPGHPIIINHTNMEFPDFRNEYMLEQDSEKLGSKMHSPPVLKKRLEQCFILNYNIIMRREYGINIIVKKGSDRATFTVPSNQWKTFFKDRIPALSKTGRMRPIYHAVVAHKRRLKKRWLREQKISYVKTHYRGLRHFFWHGYEIQIVMQGKHGISQATLDVTGVDPEEAKGKTVSLTGKWADRLNTLFETGRQAPR